jgi:hypothetical protein
MNELCCTLLSYAEDCWASLNPTELRCALGSYSVLYWAMHHLVSYTIVANWATFSTRTFEQFCQMPECRTVRYRNKCIPVRYRKCIPVRYRNATVPDWDAGCRNTDAQLCLLYHVFTVQNGHPITVYLFCAWAQGVSPAAHVSLYFSNGTTEGGINIRWINAKLCCQCFVVWSKDKAIKIS